MAPPKDKWVRRFVISETNRHKKGFTIYKVTSVMFLKMSPDMISKVSVWKRYSDFKKLYSTMQSMHFSKELGEPFPPFPKPKFFGRFETEVVEQRRECALRFLEFIGRHSVLYTSDVFIKFFEKDLNKRFPDCSPSLSSDTSEDDRNVNCENEESSFSSTTDLPKFVCTKKMKPIKVGKQNKIKSNKVDGNSQEQHHVDNNSTSKNKSEDSPETSNGSDNFLKDKTSASKPTLVIHDGSDLTQSTNDCAQYILIAAAHMSAAFRHEAIAEYEEAFTQYKLGISHLMNGVQSEADEEKKTMIHEKITKYLQRAERLYNRHLNCNVSALYKPVAELRNYKVIELMETVMLVQDTLQGFKRVIKTVEKSTDCEKDISSYILRGKVPYMVQLYSCMQTDSTVFLVLQYMTKGKLWDFVRANYKPNSKRDKYSKRGHSRSFSWDSTVQNDAAGNRPKITITKEHVAKSSSSGDNHCLNLASDFATSDTTELVKNAQKLLQSVNATLKRSNSIASRLNESEDLLYEQNTNKDIEDSIISHLESALKTDSLCVGSNENTDDSEDLSELSASDSCTDLNLDKEVHVKSSDQSKNDEKAVDDSLTKISNLSTLNSFTDRSSDRIESLGTSGDVSPYKKVDNQSVEKEKQNWSIPESVIRTWAAQILLALEALHQQDVIVSDLRPDNILIDDSGNASMAYIVPRNESELLRLKTPYTSPELCMFTPPISITTSADVWSFGVLLYELLTGFDFQIKHPGQFHSHSLINIPEDLSENAKSLLLNVLKYQPSDRLSIPEIKQHQFFTKINWLELLNAQI
ncbi:ribosomal protein S6 kinase delta-1 [Copidosoma floridanum]|uniref:ribosomal protein S6 kinase delta-1 n=1 Tax=Copidosoma floridanum TaxID=29053 RepID=UPI0006C99C11|nr:ribosomal protein S6 kinase delta-1 [Copidosoma floridanum]